MEHSDADQTDSVAHIEDLMRRVPSGEVQAEEFFAAMADTELLVLVTNESTPDDMSLPVLDREGTSIIPVFTSEARMAEFGAGDRNYLQVHGRELVDIWPKDMACALNPGTEGQAMDIPAEVINHLPEHSAFDLAPRPTAESEEDGAVPLGLGGLTVATTDEISTVVEEAAAGMEAVSWVRLYSVQDVGGEPETAVVVRFAPGHASEDELVRTMAALLAAAREVAPEVELMAEDDLAEVRSLLPGFRSEGNWLRGE